MADKGVTDVWGKRPDPPGPPGPITVNVNLTLPPELWNTFSHFVEILERIGEQSKAAGEALARIEAAIAALGSGGGTSAQFQQVVDALTAHKTHLEAIRAKVEAVDQANQPS